MFKNGFDENQPVVLAKWKGQDEPVCVDGYTRISVAEDLGIEEIPTVTYAVDTEKDAFELALKRQINRRNLTDSEIYQCVETMRTRYGDPPNGGLGFSVQEIADKLGISKRKAERSLRVMEQATPEIKRQIKTGKTSINKAESTVRGASREHRPASDKPKIRRSESRMVEIDPEQWLQLEFISHYTDASMEDLIYEALEEYLKRKESVSEQEEAEDDSEDEETQDDQDTDDEETEDQ